MQPKLIKTQNAQYVPGVFDGDNKSGWTPIGDKVLVLTDQPAKETSGGIMLPEDLIERNGMAAETGILIEYGEDAFKFSKDGMPRSGPKPKIGSYVYIERYSGQLMLGDDGQFYRMMSDHCIAAVKPSVDANFV
ncbi:hypothetical protein [Bradyrhizobium sp. dw_78]|uniref:hypothetical protein n=1 Tax=Bradyrhizobium sp. dw_78 TaxID=2719793 RepID=UPI001BD4907B|nr:hypothetical protein [Bradyrhizobium sp. dw_78]